MAEAGTQLLTQIAVSSHQPLTGRAIADRYKRLFSAYAEQFPMEVAQEPRKPEETVRLLLGKNGETGIDVLALPIPIPPDMLTFAYALNGHWPEARTEMQRSRAHVAAIALKRQDGRNDPIRDMIGVTLVTACLLELAPALGVFCPSGNALTPPRRYRELAQGMLKGEPAVEAWVQAITDEAPPERGQRRRVAMSNGLRAIVGREIEIQPVARDEASLRRAVQLLARFVLQRGAPFDDGDGVTLEKGDAAAVRLAAEGRRSGIPIFETRLAKLDAQGRLPPEAFGDRPLAPRTPPRVETASEKMRFMAMIPLARPTPISLEMLIAAARRRFPDYKGEIAAPGGAAPSAENSHLLLVGGGMMALMSVDAPMPPGALDGPVAGAEFTWPQARATVADHKAHVIVASMADAKDWRAALARATDVSVIAAAIGDVAPAMGAIWCAADLIAPMEKFQEAVASALAGKPPVDSWVRINLFKAATENGQPGIGVTTAGLVPFIGREIEFRPARLHPAVAAQRVLGTAAYLLASGPVLEHGHTLGVSQAEAIRVRHVERGPRTGAPIYDLTLELLDGAVKPAGVQAAEPPPAPANSDAAGPRLATAASAETAAAPPAAAPAPAPPKPTTAPNGDASRLVRNLRRPQG
jgi:hypothetical protein